MAILGLNVAAAASLAMIFFATGGEGKHPCQIQDGERYYKTDLSYVQCSKSECPPFQQGKHKNCFCCNGPDENPVDGQWAEWSTWTNCSSSPQNNAVIRYRIRTCSNPAPLRKGNLCFTTGGNGSTYEYEQKPCPFVVPLSACENNEALPICATFLVCAILAVISMGIWIRRLTRPKMIPQQCYSEMGDTIDLALPENGNNIGNTRVAQPPPPTHASGNEGYS